MTEEKTNEAVKVEETLSSNVQEAAPQVTPEANAEAPAKVESTENVETPEAPVTPAEPVQEATSPTAQFNGVQALEESLSVIKEVRSELANAYNAQKVANSTIEQLNAEIATLKSAVEQSQKSTESLSNELQGYKARDAEVAKTTYNKRLESLSANFEKLGQKKSVEQLSALSVDVVAEFETVTNMALQVRSNEALSAPLTTPTAAAPIAAPVAPVAAPAAKPMDLKDTRGVMFGVAAMLNEKQAQNHSRPGKRVTNN